MKKSIVLFIGLISMFMVNAQNVSDALRYSESEIQGTARFRALSGAFGALGGDMSAVSLNPAGSAIFNSSHASISLSNNNKNNDVSYFEGFNKSSNSNISLNQVGASIVLKNRNQESDWKKVTFGFAYDRSNDYNDDWLASGTNTNVNPGLTNSIASYFLANANGLRLDEISRFDGETYPEAYADIGSNYGYDYQQAFLGYESFIIDPNPSDPNYSSDINAVTTYIPNIEEGNFNHEYSYAATGYNGKFAINFATQYKDNLYLGINLNSHFIDYKRSTYLFESNTNTGSLINEVGFNNTLSTVGTGFSIQLGAISKLTDNFRIGLSYKSPTWYSISDETTQSIATRSYDGILLDNGDTSYGENINPQIVNIFADYKLQTPSKLTGSLAYIFGKRGLISFDYSRKDYSKIKFKPTSDPDFNYQNNFFNNNLESVSTYRIGGEYKHKQFSFRGGYRMEESPYKNESAIGDLTGYSLGLGYSFGNTKLDLTFDTSEREANYQLFDIGLTDSANINAENTNITLSLSFNL